MMATSLGKSGGLMIDRGGLEHAAMEKPKDHLDLGLCLVLIVLVALALLVSFR